MSRRQARVHAAPVLASRGYAESGLSPERLSQIMDAAVAGDAQAAYELGCFYKVGAGVHQDLGAAAKWWRTAATGGVAKAQVQLAILYQKGLGVPLDMNEAIRWYRAAAEQEETEIQLYLGRLLWKGGAVRMDRTEAAHWWGRAALTGNSQALWNMGIAYWYGWNGARDRWKAMRLFYRALDDPAISKGIERQAVVVRGARRSRRMAAALGIVSLAFILYLLLRG